ncbi:PREDICTED: protein NUCLEAR FUSION DEFECTIVE 4-like [Ipomoea nil]|uniref:protein NUCLEAR FUSION DEFECTIVE 4-like n=1 Tax=Ipomoea nil TaxID=35883 RepID=UPI0009012504|nr:PREDICTED: protein NUCLEAR FUSION DEFECTIVE 4-like [Ipomoea nil]
MAALQWLSLVAAIWLQAVSGTNTNFPVYSSRLKHLLSISQVQLNNLAFANDAGKLFGWFSGIAALYLPLWLVLLLGSSLGFVGYGVQYLFLVGKIAYLSYWHVFVLTALAGNSICWINTVCYIVAIRNFPSDRQVAVGISTSYVGLSAKIFTDIVEAAMNVSSPTDRAHAYLLLNSLLPLIVAVVASPIAREIKIGVSRRLAGGFSVMFAITIATGVYAVITTTLGSEISRKKLLKHLSFAGMAVLLCLPTLVPLGQKITELCRKKCPIRPKNQVCDHQGSDFSVGIEGGEVKEEEQQSQSVIVVVEEVEWKDLVKRGDFWLYFLVYFLGATLGLVYLNNLGQIAESRGFSNASLLVSLSSSFGFFGRLLPSLYDYFFSMSKNKISRPASIAVMMAPMCGAFFLLLHGGHGCLYTSTAIIGVCTGAITSVAVSTTTELFGAKNFGVNHNILVTNIPIGSFIFGDFAAYVYKRQGRISGGSDGICTGMQCFHTTFVVWGCLCFFGTCLAVLFHSRTRRN